MAEPQTTPEAKPAKFATLGDQDALKNGKTVYDVSYKELVWRNFLAGMSRSIGMVFVQFVFFVVIAGILAQLVLPRVMGVFSPYLETLQSLQGGNQQMQQNLDSLMQMLP